MQLLTGACSRKADNSCKKNKRKGRKMLEKIFKLKQNNTTVKTEILAGNAKKVGDYFTAKLEKLPHVKEVRHQGLLVGVEFDDTISGVDVKHGCFDRHMLITAIGSHIIRMVPPLIVSEEECDKAFDIIKETVESLS